MRYLTLPRCWSIADSWEGCFPDKSRILCFWSAAGTERLSCGTEQRVCLESCSRRLSLSWEAEERFEAPIHQAVDPRVTQGEQKRILLICLAYVVVAFVSQKFILFKILLSDTIHPVSIEFIGIPTHLCECPEFVGARGFLSLLSQVRYTVSHLFLLCRLYILNIEQDQADFFSTIRYILWELRYWLLQ